jgi:hypothetical protein
MVFTFGSQEFVEAFYFDNWSNIVSVHARRSHDFVNSSELAAHNRIDPDTPNPRPAWHRSPGHNRVHRELAGPVGNVARKLLVRFNHANGDLEIWAGGDRRRRQYDGDAWSNIVSAESRVAPVEDPVSLDARSRAICVPAISG